VQGEVEARGNLGWLGEHVERTRVGYRRWDFRELLGRPLNFSPSSQPFEFGEGGLFERGLAHKKSRIVPGNFGADRNLERVK